MKYIFKHLRVAWAFFIISWKNSIEYMNDFVVLCIDFIVTIATTIIFWKYLLVDFNSLGNWSMEGLILIGIFGNASWAIGELFAGSWDLSNKIIEGKLDKYLCRPVNAFFSLVLESMQVEEFIKGIVSLFVLLVWYHVTFLIKFNIINFVFSLSSLMLGVVIVALVRCIYCCSSFWFENTDGFNMLIHMEDFQVDRYPINMFNKVTQVILISIVPVGFVSCFPAMFYLGLIDKNGVYLFLELIIMLIITIILHFIWRKGIRRYEASGG